MSVFPMMFKHIEEVKIKKGEINEQLIDPVQHQLVNLMNWCLDSGICLMLLVHGLLESSRVIVKTLTKPSWCTSVSRLDTHSEQPTE